MSFSKVRENATKPQFEDLNLSIIGLGTEYPPYLLESSVLNVLSERHYPESPAMSKVLMINNYTGIDTRSAIGSVDHALVNLDRAPTIDDLSKLFLTDGVELAVTAAQKALNEAQLSPSDITHIVSTTCTNSANPGFDHYVCKQLGIVQPVEKVLLHGIGCSGGLASLRTAANLALGSSFRNRKATVLIVALEICSLLVRSELDSIHERQETRIGVTLFSDCASSLILSNGLGLEGREHIYDLIGWDHGLIPDTDEDLGFTVDPLGWKVVLSLRVPKLASAAVAPAFANLLSTFPHLPAKYKKASDFDWALHPGGATILSGVERAMNITPEHMRASYDTYINHGNSSSATIFSVLDRLRDRDMDNLAPDGDVKDFVVGCAFGPGISIEMCMLKRNLSHVKRKCVMNVLREVTPPDAEDESSRGEDKI
ncbi:thiolase-like protein [Bisporella sp. PMI_857]|nr:thiolase-like protein [Bisporella sp. PMI_857]